jgi:hypothetical protein
LVELALIELVDEFVREPTHDEIHFTGTAMPGAKQKPAPARVQAVARSGAPGHLFSNAQNAESPDVPGRAYIGVWTEDVSAFCVWSPSGV